MLVRVLHASTWLVLFATSQAAPSSTASVNPCAALSSSANAQAAQATPTFRPSDVYACLEDVPVNKTQAVYYLEFIEAFVNFQTTLAYLKNPPSSYQNQAVDVLGQLDIIKRDASDGGYMNDIKLETDLYTLFSQAADGHFKINPNILYSFNMQRSDELVSISFDGQQLPKLYLLSDMLLALANDDVVISEIVQFGGDSNTTGHVLALPQLPFFQDLDASYNFRLYNPSTNFFKSLPSSAPVFDTWTSSRPIRGDDQTIYKFANGSTVSRRNFATLGALLKEIDFDSGDAFYSKYIAPGGQQTAQGSQTASPTATQDSGATSSSMAAATSAPPTLTGYPSPVIEHSTDMIAGYFLDGNDTSDVAVLNFASFAPVSSNSENLEHQQVLSKFLAQCQGKSRLIIDVRGNGGGTLFLAFDSFRQLFPSLGTPYSGVRFRTDPYTDFIGAALTESGEVGASISTSSFVQSPDGSLFPDWSALYGPHEVYGDNFSTVASWRFDNASIDEAQAGITISGYGNLTNIPASPFDASNVTVLTDGSCSSTCATFVNLLVNQAKVKSVVVGGRPSNAPMALIGGTQGGNDLSNTDFKKYSNIAIKYLNSTEALRSTSDVAISSLETFVKPPPMQLLGWSVNFRDSIAQNDTSQTPLQFTYTPADCRMFYMAADIIEVNNTWTRVARGVAADGNGLCINGTVSSWKSQPSGGSSSGANGSAWVSGFATTAALLVFAVQALSGMWI